MGLGKCVGGRVGVVGSVLYRVLNMTGVVIWRLSIGGKLYWRVGVDGVEGVRSSEWCVGEWGVLVCGRKWDRGVALWYSGCDRDVDYDRR